MLSAVFFHDLTGNQIISRSYEPSFPDISKTVLGSIILNCKEVPVKTVGDYVFVISSFEKIFITFVISSYIIDSSFLSSSLDSLPSLAFSFSQYLYKSLHILLKTVDENSILENAFYVYDILDEVIDYGLPQLTSPKQLVEFCGKTKLGSIEQFGESFFNSGKMVNDFYLDHFEMVDMILDDNGQVVQSAVRGKLEAVSNLEGNPRIRIQFKENFLLPSSVGGQARKFYRTAPGISRGFSSFRGNRGYSNGSDEFVEIGAVRFHECVKLDRSGSDSYISMQPPNGSFELMTYRYNKEVKPIFAVSASAVLRGQTARTALTLHSSFSRKVVAAKVKVVVPVSVHVKKVSFKEQVGSSVFKADKGVIEWEMFNFEGGRDVALICNFVLSNSSIDVDKDELEKDIRKPVKVIFEISNFTISGFAIKDISISEKSGYEANTYFNYSTRNGVYEVRVK